MHIVTALSCFLQKNLRLLNIGYLLNTSFNALAGKNFTFCDAAI